MEPPYATSPRHVLRSPFFWRLFVPYAILLLLSLGVTGALVVQRYRNDRVEELQHSLQVQVLALAQAAAENFPETPDELSETVRQHSQLTGRRVTFIRRDGTVVADSSVDPASMDNHADRPEIRTALASGMGLFRRPSDSVGELMAYAAHVPDHTSQRAGVVRVAASAARVEEAVSRIRGLFLTGAVLAALTALGLGALAVRRFAGPLGEVREVAQSMAAGDYRARYSGRENDEIGVLGRTLNHLGNEMSQRVAALTAGQDRLRAMVAGMVEGVVAVDENDRITFTNRTAVRMLGIADDAEAREERLWEAARIPDLPELLAEARRSDAAAMRELELMVGGREVVVRAQAHRFADGGRTGVVVVLHDITELRRLERIRRDFVANVSHELKTPLTSIRGFVETLLDGAVEDKENNVRFLEKIEQNVERLSHLVTDLLSLARIESQEGGLNLERVDLQGLLEAAVRRHEPSAMGRDQSLRFETCSGDVQVLGDREAVTQVVDNLLDNAIKYTQSEGSITLRLAHEGNHATIEVIDDGIGIPEDDLDRVFERFYRVDKARSREVGGTGLGLSIVKHLVAAMKGEITVTSRVGEGTRFRVRLRLA